MLSYLFIILEMTGTVKAMGTNLTFRQANGFNKYFQSVKL